MQAQRRYISFKSLGSIFSRASGKSNPVKNNNEITETMNKLPTSTGAGAFVEPTSFEILGNFSNLLNIKLPASSILNLRYNNKNQSIVAMNGDVGNLYVELGKIQTSRDYLLFQRCFNSKSAMSILMSTKANNANFSVIDVKDTTKFKWIITNKDSLVAWSGNYLNISLPTRSLFRSGDSATFSPEALYLPGAVEANGEGQIVLSSLGQILQIQLEEGEKISVNPSNVIAYTIDAQDSSNIGGQPTEVVRSLVNLSVPQFSIWSQISILTRRTYEYLKVQVNKVVSKATKNDESQTPLIPKEKDSSSTSVSTSIASFLKHPIVLKTLGYYTTLKNATVKKAKKLYVGSDDAMIELTGPKTVLINNYISPSAKILTQEQIENLYK